MSSDRNLQVVTCDSGSLWSDTFAGELRNESLRDVESRSPPSRIFCTMHAGCQEAKCQNSSSTAKRGFSSALLLSMNALVTGRVCARCFESRQQQQQIASRSPFFRQQLPCRQQQFWGQRRLLTDPVSCFAAGRAQKGVTQVQISHAWGVMHNLLSAVLGIKFQRCTRRIACSTRGSLSQVTASGSDDRPASDDKIRVLFICLGAPLAQTVVASILELHTCVSAAMHTAVRSVSCVRDQDLMRNITSASSGPCAPGRQHLQVAVGGGGVPGGGGARGPGGPLRDRLVRHGRRQSQLVLHRGPPPRLVLPRRGPSR
jgi:hypothetical protein